MVEIYKGKFVDAEDAEKYIDVDTIRKCCESLKDGAERLSHTKDRVINAKSFCGRDSFYIGEYTYEDQAEKNATSLRNASEYIEEFSVNVLNALEKALDKKQTELNEVAKEEDLKLIEANSSNDIL